MPKWTARQTAWQLENIAPAASRAVQSCGPSRSPKLVFQPQYSTVHRRQSGAMRAARLPGERRKSPGRLFSPRLLGALSRYFGSEISLTAIASPSIRSAESSKTAYLGACGSSSKKMVGRDRRDRTRTCDLLRVKQAFGLLGIDSTSAYRHEFDV